MGHDWQGATWSGPFHSIDTITVTAVMTDNTTVLIIINSVLKPDNSYKPRVRELPGRDTALNLKFFKVFLLLNYLFIFCDHSKLRRTILLSVVGS